MISKVLPKLEFSLHHDYMRGGVVLLAFHERGYVTLGAGGELVFQEADPGVEVAPLLTFSRNATQSLQSLADALAKFGVMPSAGDNARELQATKAHLEDMRSMAMRSFDRLIAETSSNAKPG